MEQAAERPQIKLEFGFSASPNYERATAIAQRLPGYTSWGEGRKRKHQVTFVAEEVEAFLQLSGLVTEWKSTIFWLDERELGRRGPFRLIYCTRDRLNAYDPPAYCAQNNY